MKNLLTLPAFDTSKFIFANETPYQDKFNNGKIEDRLSAVPEIYGDKKDAERARKELANLNDILDHADLTPAQRENLFHEMFDDIFQLRTNELNQPGEEGVVFITDKELNDYKDKFNRKVQGIVAENIREDVDMAEIAYEVRNKLIDQYDEWAGGDSVDWNDNDNRTFFIDKKTGNLMVDNNDWIINNRIMIPSSELNGKGDAVAEFLNANKNIIKRAVLKGKKTGRFEELEKKLAISKKADQQDEIPANTSVKTEQEPAVVKTKAKTTVKEDVEIEPVEEKKVVKKEEIKFETPEEIAKKKEKIETVKKVFIELLKIVSKKYPFGNNPSITLKTNPDFSTQEVEIAANGKTIGTLHYDALSNEFSYVATEKPQFNVEKGNFDDVKKAVFKHAKEINNK